MSEVSRPDDRLGHWRRTVFKYLRFERPVHGALRAVHLDVAHNFW